MRVADIEIDGELVAVELIVTEEDTLTDTLAEADTLTLSLTL